jgi:hypothetical protein
MSNHSLVASAFPVCLNRLKIEAAGARVSEEIEGQDTGTETVGGGAEP